MKIVKKNKRRIMVFVPEEDVERMLRRAQKAGLSLGKVLNPAAREYFPKLQEKLSHALDESFRNPDHRHDQALAA